MSNKSSLLQYLHQAMVIFNKCFKHISVTVLQVSLTSQLCLGRQKKDFASIHSQAILSLASCLTYYAEYHAHSDKWATSFDTCLCPGSHPMELMTKLTYFYRFSLLWHSLSQQVFQIFSSQFPLEVYIVLDSDTSFKSGASVSRDTLVTKHL